MYVCLCRGVTDKEIRKAVKQGCDAISELQEVLGVGTGCGQCLEMAEEIIQSALIDIQINKDKAA